MTSGMSFTISFHFTNTLCLTPSQKLTDFFVQSADFFTLFSSANPLNIYISYLLFHFLVSIYYLSFQYACSNILSYYPIISFTITFAFHLILCNTNLCDTTFHTRYLTVSSVIKLKSDWKDIVYDNKSKWIDNFYFR